MTAIEGVAIVVLTLPILSLVLPARALIRSLRRRRGSVPAVRMDDDPPGAT